MSKPRVFYDRQLGCWVADNGYETGAFPTWNRALRMVAGRWYGWSGQQWAKRHLPLNVGRRVS